MTKKVLGVGKIVYSLLLPFDDSFLSGFLQLDFLQSGFLP